MFNAKNTDKFVSSYCNKNYKARNSLWYHEKKCNHNISHTTNNDNFIFDKEFVMLILKQNREVIKQNSELHTNMKAQQNIMLEFIKNVSHNTNNNYSHNKTFNLQFFLHFKCRIFLKMYLKAMVATSLSYLYYNLMCYYTQYKF